MEYNFCRRCGGQLQEVNNSMFSCRNEHHTFLASSPTVGIFFIRKNKIILSRRGIQPKKGTLDCIGGFVDINENYEQAISREIVEETGLNTSDYTNIRYLCSETSDYEYQSESRQVLSIFYVAELLETAKPIAKDDVASIEEMDIENININEIGQNDVKKAFTKLKETLK